MPPFEGFLEKAALEAGEGSSHENWNTLACTKFVPDADFSEVSQFGAKEVKVAKEIGSEDKKKKKLISPELYPGAFNPRIGFAAHHYSLSQEKEMGMRGLSLVYPVVLVCSIAHAASMQCCNRTALPGRASFQQQDILSTPPSWSQQMMKQLFLTKLGFCTGTKKVCDTFSWKVGGEGLYFVLEVLRPTPFLSFQMLLQLPSFCFCWVPLVAFQTGNFSCQNY